MVKPVKLTLQSQVIFAANEMELFHSTHLQIRYFLSRREKRVYPRQHILKGCNIAIPTLRNMEILILATVFSLGGDIRALGRKMRTDCVIVSLLNVSNVCAMKITNFIKRAGLKRVSAGKCKVSKRKVHHNKSPLD